MERFWTAAGGWYHAILLAALPWCAALRPEWAPAIVGLLAALILITGRPRGEGPWPSTLVAASSVVFIVSNSDWRIAAGWLLLAAAVAGLTWISSTRSWMDSRAASLVGLATWAVAFVVKPDLLIQGGWLAPALLLLAVQRTVVATAGGRAAAGILQPPSREVRGTLSLRSVVATGADGLPRTVPLELELRAGRSLAVLCDSVHDGEVLLAVLSGRRQPAAGSVAVDGTALGSSDRLVAVAAPGEPFVAGDLEMNLSVLCDVFPDRDTIVAVMDACSLAEAADHLGRGTMAEDGAPLTTPERLHVAAARILPSNYRIMVVLDPMPWSNAVRGELWRSTVVRASLGRTAVWITADRDLAGRADDVLVFRNGALRAPDRTIGDRV